ncbi:flagellin N-terminal helical domain-containing protein [Arthrobacter dokdonensis]|uniref:flagellin N-terminal helical domain-containing protein n=1 Tax=Arthrobacter dokdonellae TaxID=2211210 RepID=UPI000DE5926A|nr:flagellin [Arthrobacter dokdonellae]
MGMQVNTNLAANNAYRNLNNTQNALSKSMEKLSSGLRINRAADDAAGLAISEGLKSQVNGYGVAARNAQDGISVIQTAEGALTEVHSILQRMRDLAVQAGNDSNNADSRDAITKEATQLSQELTRISGATNFNGTKLLDGKANLNFQIGADGNASSTLNVDLTKADVGGIAAKLAATTTTSGTTFNIAAFDGTTGAPTLTATAYNFKSTSADGNSTSSVDVTLSGTAKTADDLAAELNKDAGFSAKFTATAVKDSNGLGTGIVVKANDGSTVDGGTATGGLAAGVVGAAVAGLDFGSHDGAQAAITAIDIQIKAVSAVRADIGAVQNRFESAINSLNVGKENLTAASSRITDVDMASEMVSFTRSNILSQAGTAMLAQANQSNQGVLKLLG